MRIKVGEKLRVKLARKVTLFPPLLVKLVGDANEKSEVKLVGEIRRIIEPDEETGIVEFCRLPSCNILFVGESVKVEGPV